MRMAVEEQIPFVTIAQAQVEFLWPGDDEADSLISLFNSARKCFFVSHGESPPSADATRGETRKRSK